MNEIITNEVKVLRPNIKDIVTVRGNWTKGKSYFYLIDFVDPEKDWVSGYRIIPGSKSSYAFEGLYIPAVYTDSKVDALHNGGYVNVFTGRTSINVSSIFEIVSTLLDDIFYRIIAMDLSVRLGNWSKDSEGKYKIKEASIPITLDVRASSMIRSMAMANIMPEEPIKLQQPKQRKDSGNESVSKVTEEIIEHYRTLASGDDRIDYIFELFGVNGVVSPNTAYSTIFEYKDRTSTRSTSIILNREQFMFVVGDTAEGITNRNDIRKFDGSLIKNMSIATARSLQYKVKKLYYGGEKTSNNKITKEIESKIIDLFDKGYSISSIAVSVNISMDTVRKVLLNAGKIERKETNRVNTIEYFSNIASVVKADGPELYAKYRNDIIDIQKSAIFIGKHEYLLGVLASDKLDSDISELKEYDGNLDILRFTAIRCKSFAFTYEAPYLFPEYLLTHDTEFLSLFIVDRNRKITHCVMKNTVSAMKKLAAVHYSGIKFDEPVESLADENRKPNDPYRLLHQYLIYLVNKIRSYKNDIAECSTCKFINSRYGIPNSYMEYYGEHYRKIQ